MEQKITVAGKRCLVTGGEGFIGSHLVDMLIQEGAQTRAMVLYNSFGSRGWLDQLDRKDEVEIIAGDVTDRDSVEKAIRGVDVVFHLAALVAIPYSYQAPESYIRTNVMGTLNVLQASRKEGVGRVVHTSTSEVYGTARSVPIPEDHPLQGQSPYSASKIGADKIAEAMHLSFDLPLVTIRPFNTYGPRQSDRAVIPTIIGQCLAGGHTIQLGNLHPTRDLSYVEDTVRGFILGASATGAIGKTINLGSGREIAIGDLARLIAEEVGVNVLVTADESRFRPSGSEVNRLLADNSLARSLLGWEPRISLREGLRQTISWVRQHPEHYRPSEYVV